jgi:hypothetical protein
LNKGEKTMGGLTKLYVHSGTTDPTNIGPSGGVLHSITIVQAGPTKVGSLVVRDGGPTGAIIFELGESVRSVSVEQLKWAGVKIDGQLNVTLGHVNQKVSIEMSGASPAETSDKASTELKKVEEARAKNEERAKESAAQRPVKPL